MTVDTSVTLAGIPLKNPIMTASGTSGHGLELAPFFDLSILGAFVTKGVSIAPRAGNAPPRLQETPAGLLNAIGLENPGVPAFCAQALPGLSALGIPVIVNCFGEDPEKTVAAVEALSREPAVTALELNVSCPNVKAGGIAFGTDPAVLRPLVEACRRVCPKPLLVKLSPNVTSIVAMAAAALEGGADGLTCVNTLLGCDVDVRRRRFLPGPGRGGLSGPATLPVALLKVAEVHRAFPKTPIIGVGGVRRGEDVLKFLLAGATAVQVGTAILIEPTAPVRILREFIELCEELNIQRPAEVVGTATVG
ncbi:dihydroorotate dehydrogenase [Myxococcota bacterium]|nr:dihydroorotate dehydrogenase [Myxococcota bacterium]MBU1413400.1 dihydroorotate dehydrogenase [Myxococcota bacterium]MBU1510109.1 dihydroorotate dehydrogenase [Myxococcota bacterium]